MGTMVAACVPVVRFIESHPLIWDVAELEWLEMVGGHTHARGERERPVYLMKKNQQRFKDGVEKKDRDGLV